MVGQPGPDDCAHIRVAVETYRAAHDVLETSRGFRPIEVNAIPNGTRRRRTAFLLLPDGRRCRAEGATDEGSAPQNAPGKASVLPLTPIPFPARGEGEMPRNRPHVLGRPRTPADPTRFRAPRPGDALRPHRRRARRMVRTPPTLCAPHTASCEGTAVRLSLRRQPQLHSARRGRSLLRRFARARRRSAAPARGHRNPQGPDRGAE